MPHINEKTSKCRQIACVLLVAFGFIWFLPYMLIHYIVHVTVIQLHCYMSQKRNDLIPKYSYLDKWIDYCYRE